MTIGHLTTRCAIRCFIDTDTHLKSGALTILELLALNAKKIKGSRDPDNEPF